MCNLYSLLSLTNNPHVLFKTVGNFLNPYKFSRGARLRKCSLEVEDKCWNDLEKLHQNCLHKLQCAANIPDLEFEVRAFNLQFNLIQFSRSLEAYRVSRARVVVL